MFNKDGEIHIIASLLDFGETDNTENITLKIKADKPKAVTQNVINSDYSNPYALWKKRRGNNVRDNNK